LRQRAEIVGLVLSLDVLILEVFHAELFVDVIRESLEGLGRTLACEAAAAETVACTLEDGVGYDSSYVCKDVQRKTNQVDYGMRLNYS
jgi:hypothetical protein